MDVNDIVKCHLIGIYKLPKSEKKTTIVLVQYTLKRTPMIFQLLYHGMGSLPVPNNNILKHYNV